MSVEDVAGVTKIRPEFLKSLEAGRHDQLPGQFFVVNFLHQYASALDLEFKATDRRALRKELRQSREAGPATARSIPSRSKTYFWIRALSRVRAAMGKSAGLVGKVALAAVLVGGLYWAYRYTRSAADGGLGSDAVSVPAAVAETLDEGSGESPEAVRNAPTTTLQGQSVPAPAPVAADRAPTAAAAARTERAAAALPQGSLHVEVLATEQVWIRAVSDGTSRREFVLQPGKRWQTRAEASVDLMLGNAGGVVLRINGREQAPVGSSGQVRRVRLTSEGVQVGRG